MDRWRIQNSRAPRGTSWSGAKSTTAPEASGKPIVNTSERIGPIWGFGGGQELRNMYTCTAQPGLWFIAGSFAQCRIYSKFLALQIKADEEGLNHGTA